MASAALADAIPLNALHVLQALCEATAAAAAIELLVGLTLLPSAAASAAAQAGLQDMDKHSMVWLEETN
jgi:hypothetical protein